MATIEELETRVGVLERLVQELKLEKIAKVLVESGGKKSKSPRKTREYTQAEKAAIRERLFAGQEAARKKKEAEAKANKKVRTETTDKGKASEPDKPASPSSGALWVIKSALFYSFNTLAVS